MRYLWLACCLVLSSPYLSLPEYAILVLHVHTCNMQRQHMKVGKVNFHLCRILLHHDCIICLSNSLAHTKLDIIHHTCMCMCVCVCKQACACDVYTCMWCTCTCMYMYMYNLLEVFKHSQHIAMMQFCIHVLWQ